MGVAIALNLVKATNDAEIAAGDMVTAAGVTISALMAGDGTPMDSFGAKATSGASAGKVAVAGSLAINIVQANSATASIDSTSTVNAGGDPVMVLSADTANSVADAEPVNEGATSTGKLGVGASIALNITPDTTSSTIGDAATLSDASDVTLSAIGTYTETTTAVNGAMASDGTGIGISVAIAIVNNSATATVGALSNPLVITRRILLDGDADGHGDDVVRRQGRGYERGGDRDWCGRGDGQCDGDDLAVDHGRRCGVVHGELGGDDQCVGIGVGSRRLVDGQLVGQERGRPGQRPDELRRQPGDELGFARCAQRHEGAGRAEQFRHFGEPCRRYRCEHRDQRVERRPWRRTWSSTPAAC